MELGGVTGIGRLDSGANASKRASHSFTDWRVMRLSASRSGAIQLARPVADVLTESPAISRKLTLRSSTPGM